MASDSNLIDRVQRRFRLSSSYKAVFNGQGETLSQPGTDVMKDLAVFCYATKTTQQAGPNGFDPIAAAMAEGRRQVYLRILGNLRSNDAAMLDKLLESER